MAKLSGGGIQGNKNVNVGVRTGAGSKGSSPAAAAQLGASTAFRRDQVDAGPAYNPTKYGNEMATNVGKGGPGTGRTVMPSGSQSLHGPVNKGESQRDQSRGFDVQGRGKDVV